ncbi:unnamed protein product [marine sediment metagenome]|uniref:UDP-glucose/GDP-mannose dehydrogenase C-terminal domain-containing protein n=1 Tax=marine sediment metagenome TaxID=412755 RepID=X0U5N9_9ZZZZ
MLGLAFKENIRDIRNSKTVDIVRELEDSGVQARVHDPLVLPQDAEREYGIRLSSVDELAASDGVILVVAHRVFCESGRDWMRSLLRRSSRGVVMDVKSVFRPEDFPEAAYWRL